ncbi:valine--tRNA ligase [Sphingosinicella sp. LHD-64]|uniref:valine--tRNA ligase n=1 Tax=Sphingosinicella sp. LHD-64 TaxID=3072139 RepID=UPI00280C5F97|nr:valine--tRNA ligase [Sphingosinicella sp. LHD-64]MDQ8754878.1 valine--tRNA ligase [Sphingosinicella sp. LHD-64]
MSELPKTFEPGPIEARWYAHWEENGLFRAERNEAEPYTIVIPPPNVTGSLHIGHALDNTLQDILIRHARMQGKDALWVVGMDHAGIATQMVVERQMEERQDKRTNYSRDEFVAKVWEWKAESGGQITRQLRRLGASCDWRNERFTMDEGFSKAVLKVFVDLYERKLLYRDKRLVNWDPGLKTAISDLEVETRDVQGKFWHFRYPLEDGSGHISVATTRPETMLADMAVAVNPEDERYKALVGKNVRLPVTGRLVPIITDEHADPELGSGAVKITPGHDFNDFEVGRRAGIKPADMLNMLDGDAKVIQTADGLIPDDLLGLDRFDARKRVVALIEEAGLLEQVEDRTVATPFGDRSGAVIEPWLTDQWYVDAETLAKKPIEAVRSGDIRIVPKTWEKTWFNWLENIQPWCVSRQLWWGHRIPAWYGPVLGERGDQTFKQDFAPAQKTFVAETEAEALLLAREYYGSKHQVSIADSRDAAFDGFLKGGDTVHLWRDPDVLDTWFSSALWPFATLGWPDNAEPTLSPGGRGQGEGAPTSERSLEGRTPSPQPSPPGGEGAKWVAKPGSELARHYPNDVLVSGFDIIFFWDARMAMQGFEFMGERPWKTLYLHGLVRDAKGQKMSKSKGNTVDPLGLIDTYGADALRFTLAAMESQGRDIKLDEKRVEGYRNFATKLWNAARFCQANGIGASKTIEPPQATLPVNTWIIGETVKTVQALDLALAELRFDESANAVYQFTWGTFCDWYLELIKPVLSPLPLTGGDQGEGNDAAETREVAAWVLDQILVMLHPFMPFVTEELWGAIGERPYPLILAKWPMPDARALDPEAGLEIDWLIRLVSGIRTARSELNVPPGAKLPLHVRGAAPGTSARIERHAAAIQRLARIEAIAGSEPAGGAAQIIVDEATFILPLEGVIDIAAEKTRLAKAAEAAEKERDSLAGRLDNPSFVERAKPEAVEKARADHAEKSSDAEKYRAALARLS